MTSKETLIAREIIRSHDGQMVFNLREIATIINRHYNQVAAELHRAGILVRTNGKNKEADAYDIAEYICKNRIAPIDNTKRS